MASRRGTDRAPASRCTRAPFYVILGLVVYTRACMIPLMNTASTITTIPITRTASYDRNIERTDAAGLNPCIRCGKAVAIGSGFEVHMTTDWEAAPVAATIADNDSQGWWSLGSECAKAIPAAYRKPATR